MEKVLWGITLLLLVGMYFVLHFVSQYLVDLLDVISEQGIPWEAYASAIVLTIIVGLIFFICFPSKDPL